MARFVMEAVKPSRKVETRNPDSEGSIAARILEDHGYLRRKQTPQNGQWEFRCPFHEEPGSPSGKESTKFYLNARTSQYMCMSGHCGEQGNLVMLERFFGIVDEDDTALSARYKSKNTALQEYQAQLTSDHRKFLREDKGLNDETVDKFRIGYDTGRDAYVIPYLQFGQPTAFRFYDPVERGRDEKDRPQYGGPNGSKYWWETAKDSIATPEDDIILRLFNHGAAAGDSNNQVFLCEGEFKAMLLTQWGYKAVGIPGVQNLKREWAHFFMQARQVFIVMDNDNPAFHKPDNCVKCSKLYASECRGHNPGQEGAAKWVDFFGFRAHNVVLPIPTGQKKTDINEYATRDGHSKSDFEKIITGGGKTRYHAASLAEIRNDPPDETVFLVDQLLPVAGRLLVTGAPKVGKSIFIENLVLSIAAGIPFLRRFGMANNKLTPGHRVLLLDRELSKRSLFDRFNALIAHRPGYAVADEKLLIDHDFQLALDQPGAADDLISLIRENNAEVVVLDTAYKFFANGDMESSSGLSKSFAAIDKAIKETGASFILTHHHRKGSNDKNEAPSADSVVGSFLWTGWANGTILLNFKNRSVQDPYTTVASFVAFRDTAAPDPLLLQRDKTSIGYTDITEYSYSEEPADSSSSNNGFVVTKRPKLTTEGVADLLMQAVPIEEGEFLHIAAAHFGMKVENLKIHLIDIGDRSKDFIRDGNGPFIWRYIHDKVEQTYDGSPERFDGVLAGQTTIEEMIAA